MLSEIYTFLFGALRSYSLRTETIHFLSLFKRALDNNIPLFYFWVDDEATSLKKEKEENQATVYAFCILKERASRYNLFLSDERIFLCVSSHRLPCSPEQQSTDAKIHPVINKKIIRNGIIEMKKKSIGKGDRMCATTTTGEIKNDQQQQKKDKTIDRFLRNRRKGQIYRETIARQLEEHPTCL